MKAFLMAILFSSTAAIAADAPIFCSCSDQQTAELHFVLNPTEGNHTGYYSRQNQRADCSWGKATVGCSQYNGRTLVIFWKGRKFFFDSSSCKSINQSSRVIDLERIYGINTQCL